MVIHFNSSTFIYVGTICMPYESPFLIGMEPSSHLLCQEVWLWMVSGIHVLVSFCQSQFVMWFVVSDNISTNGFADLVTRGPGPDVAPGSLFVPRSAVISDYNRVAARRWRTLWNFCYFHTDLNYVILRTICFNNGQSITVVWRYMYSVEAT
jgi:hypothetical protein